MRRQQTDHLIGVILDRHATFSLRELCRAAGTNDEFIHELVAEGIIDPMDESGDWYFHGEALLRARRAQRLMRDLDVNLQGVALVLDLMDELERLRRKASQGLG
jgi:chaperone modulatory protein CbpM